MITPEQIAAKGDEHAHQAALFQWVALVGRPAIPLLSRLHAVPNGSKLMGIGTVAGKREGARMKAEGLRPGVPDLCWPAPTRTSNMGLIVRCGLYMEMKKPGRQTEKNGGLSDQQIDWLTYLSEAGYATVVAYGWMDAAWALCNYWYGLLPQRPVGGTPWISAFGAEAAPMPALLAVGAHLP